MTDLAFARYCQILESVVARLPPEEEARQMKAQGGSVRQIAKVLSVSRETVRKWCASDGQRQPRKKHSDETEARYWELRKSGVSIRGAAKQMGLSKGTVQWWEDKAKRAAQ